MWTEAVSVLSGPECLGDHTAGEYIVKCLLKVFCLGVCHLTGLPLFSDPHGSVLLHKSSGPA